MFKTLNEIAAEYRVSAVKIGRILYALGIRNADHPIRKGFPFDQFVTHGIARPVTDKHGSIRYFTYNIAPVREEFEVVLNAEQQDHPDTKKTRSEHFILEKTEHILATLQPLCQKEPSLQSVRDAAERPGKSTL